MKKILSLLLALAISITSLTFATSAFAADSSKCASITFCGTENNSLIDEALNAINECREASNMAPLSLDNTLCEQAKQRAKDVFVYYDAQDMYLPNGDAVTSYVPTGIVTLIYAFYGIPAYDSIKSQVKSYAAHSLLSNAQSAGVGFFTINGITSMYVIYSQNQAAAPYTSFTDASVNATVNTLISNVTLRCQLEIVSGKSYAPLTTFAYFDNGLSVSGVTLTNNQVTYKSSKPSVAKIKNNMLYAKDNGSYSLTVSLNSNPALTSTESYVMSGVQRPKANITSVKSKKKKQITVSWKNNIKNISGYEIQYSTSKKFTKKTTKTVTTKGNKAKSKTISKLKSKKTYYVRIRAYKNQSQGEKFYGKYSKTLKIKVK